MSRDLRDVVNKIIVALGENEPTAEEIAGLASDLATFFDASVVLVYMGKLPLTMTPDAMPSSTQITALAAKSIEENARRTLDQMTEVLKKHKVSVTSRIEIGAGTHAIRDIIEKEQADLVIVPSWGTGLTNRLARVFSPSILEDATCPVLVLKGNRWATKSLAPRPSKTKRKSRSSSS